MVDKKTVETSLVPNPGESWHEMQDEIVEMIEDRCSNHLDNLSQGGGRVMFKGIVFESDDAPFFNLVVLRDEDLLYECSNCDTENLAERVDNRMHADCRNCDNTFNVSEEDFKKIVE